MMKLLKIGVFLPLIFFSCKSDNKTEKKDNIQNKNFDFKNSIELTKLNSDSTPYIQKFNFSSSRSYQLMGSHGTKVDFPSGCFKNYQGNVNISIIECYDINTMLSCGLTTQMKNGHMLESDGMIYIHATDEKGRCLELSKKISIEMPTKKRKIGIKIFEGIVNTNNIQWNLSKIKLTNNTVNKKVVDEYEMDNISIDTLVSDDYINTINKPEINVDKKIKNENLVNYVFQISNLGWINCDRFIEGRTKDLFVSVDKENENATFYLVLKNYTSIVAGDNRLVDGKLVFKNIPASEPFTIIGFGMKRDDLYFNMVDYTSHEGIKEFPILKKSNRKEMTNKLYDKFGRTIWSRPKIDA